jgi:hypothetical protein
MHYVDLFRETLKNLGFDPIVVANTFDLGYCVKQGWPLKMPTVEFQKNTLLVLHFQDFATVRDNQLIVELDRLEKFYGPYSNQVLVTFWNHGLDRIYRGPIKLIEFSNHNYDLALSLKARQSEWDFHIADRIKKWQCLNGRVCQHRRNVVKIIQNWEHGVFSLGDITKLSNWDYTCYRGCENDDNFIRLQYVYQQCAVNIVTETIYDTAPGIITEKTLMAFAAQQVPLLIGHQGIVQDCQELGFDMFDDVLNLKYDNLPNETRLHQALSLNHQIIDELDVKPLQARLESNKNYLLNQFPAWMEQRFRQNCAQVLHGL